MKTLQDILTLIARMQQCPTLKAYADTLTGPRTRGSTTKLGLDRLPGSIELEKEQEKQGPGYKPECDYYYLQLLPSKYPHLAPAFDARTGAVSLDEAMTNGVVVRIREGKHGPELYVDVPPERARLEPTTWLTFIVGPSKPEDRAQGAPELILYTWFPGTVLDPFDGKVLSSFTAVKLHNGE